MQIKAVGEETEAVGEIGEMSTVVTFTIVTTLIAMLLAITSSLSISQLSQQCVVRRK